MRCAREHDMFQFRRLGSEGDAMTKLTEAQWRAAKVEFDLAIAWARLEAMRGTLIAAPQENK